VTTQEAEETLLKLARRFRTPIPDFAWSDAPKFAHGGCNDTRITLEQDSYVPHLDTLAHEFAHWRAHHLWCVMGYLAFTSDPARCNPNLKKYQKLSEPPHGREFFDSLVEVVEFLYPDPDAYGWDEEGERIIQWRKKYKSELKANTAIK
jgi:hypothetical protein